ncbi:MAG: hypothetical protein IKO55_16435, partial [Kiritimatiellae bacterium]|nr:hypothetical protein [Kiritimatiellia bacterium]
VRLARGGRLPDDAGGEVSYRDWLDSVFLEDVVVGGVAARFEDGAGAQEERRAAPHAQPAYAMDARLHLDGSAAQEKAVVKLALQRLGFIRIIGY